MPTATAYSLTVGHPRNPIPPLGIGDPLPVTDALAFTAAAVRADSVDLTDLRALTRTAVQADSLGLSDSLTVTGSKVQADNTGLTDAVTVGGFTLGTTEPTAANTGVGQDGRPSRASLAAASVMTVAAARAAAPDTLAVINGSWTVAANSEVIQNKYIKGQLLIGAHAGVTVTNCVIEVPASMANAFSTEKEIVDSFTSTGMNTLSFCEITQLSGNGVMNGPGNKNVSLYRCDISRGVDNVRINQGGGGTQTGSGFYYKIEGCYLHDQIVRTPDPLQFRSDYKTHSDAIQIEGNPSGSAVRIFGNSIHGFHTTDGTSNVDYILSGGSAMACDASGNGADGSTTGTPIAFPISLSCVMITPAGGHTVSALQVEKNWLYGSNNCVNGPGNVTGSGSVLKDNRFDPYFDTAGNRISPPTWTGGMVKSGNTNISDGSAV